ncbi:MAG TPA: SRPBCC domain-containing protein [Galbitalea sp.]|jgi:uncharacterized protein YndB with AHSA1/START domain
MISGAVAQEVLLAAPLATAWSAFADNDIRETWFSLPGERSTRSHELDFRVGGNEITRSTFSNMGNPEELELSARFLDIVPGERITSSSEFRLNGELRIASVATTEFEANADGTLVRYTEQYQCFGLVGDGSGAQERGEREGGTRFMLRRLAIAVDQAQQPA